MRPSPVRRGAPRRSCFLAPILCVGVAQADLPARAAIILVSRDADAEPRWHDAEALKAEQVAVLPTAETWLLDHLADFAAGSPTRGRVVAVLGGRGGAAQVCSRPRWP